jgi:hypothetical protein
MERQSKHEERLGTSSGPSARSLCLFPVIALASSTPMAAGGAETPPASVTAFQIISAILGSSVLTAVITYSLTRLKTTAEIDKLNAETAKIKLEMQNLSGTAQDLASSSERTLVDGSNGLDGFR